MSNYIIYCQCKAEIQHPSVASELLALPEGISSSLIRINDLCGFCALKPEKIQSLFTEGNHYTVLACHSRAVSLMLSSTGVNTDKISLRVINLRDSQGGTLENILLSLQSDVIENQPEGLIMGNDWAPWYPVIDYQRCSACGQCADFCLFGVYEKTPDKVKVVNPQGCKNNCPACARICPQTAIVFPKYQQGGAISGSEQIDEQAEHQRQQADVSEILGSDVYKALEMRARKRQSLVKREVRLQAEQERAEALKNFKNLSL